MRKEQRLFKSVSSAKPVLRRDALKGLGVLVISGPALVGAACSGGETSGAADGGSAAGTADQASAAGRSTAAGSTGTASSEVKAAPFGSAGSSGIRTRSADAGVDASAHLGTSGGSPASAGHAAATNAGTGGNPSPAAGSGAAVSGGAPAAGSGAPPPVFDDAASCMLTTTDIEGPFFIDDHEFPDDESLIRSDIREGMNGVEFRLSFRLLDAKKACAPISGAELYIWHCNADGLYSGFDGQDPSKPYAGPSDPTPMNKDRFCRGVQLSDESGVASFTTVYPGWYAGRPIHIHLLGRFDGMTKRLITTQLYFAAAFTKEVHNSEPAYMARAASIPDGSANPPAGKPAMPTMKHTPGLVVGTLNVIVNRA